VKTAKHTEDQGLYVDAPARHYGAAAALAAPFDPSEGLTLQYEATLEDGLECGGAYLKFTTASDDFSPEKLDGDTPYVVMFGPDKCGNTNKIHVIIRHASPLDGSIEEKHLIDPPSLTVDSVPHVYTLSVKKDNTYEVLVDDEVKKSGSLFEDFEPSFNPPEEIDDDADEKPADWVDEAQIPDPAQSKPEDWDEDAPAMIPDPDAAKPIGWLDDEPLEVPDPDATVPEDWDEEEDGDWEAPIVPNPKCEGEDAGCGEWTPPKISNPDYKGKWYPPMIDNPEYKGVWKPRKIPNPKYFNDETPLKSIGQIGGVGLEIWTMTSGLVVDNVLVAGDDVAAGELRANAWKPKMDFIAAVAKAEEEAKAKARKEEEAAEALKGPGFASKVTDAMYSALDKLPDKVADLGRPVVDYLADSAVALYAFLTLVAVATFALIATLVMPKGEAAAADAKKGGKKTAASAKKPSKMVFCKEKTADEIQPDDEEEEAEEEKEEEEEEEEPIKSPSKRRAKRG